jgi:hypothetical protein
MDDSPEATPGDGKPTEPQLPMVISPRLDGADEATSAASAAGEEATAKPAGKADAESLSRSLRFAMLAASVAAAAALGSLVGSLSASGVARLWPGGAANTQVAAANTSHASKAELAEITALKTSLDGAARNANGQFAKVADRLDHLERAQAEPAAKIAQIAEAIDRLEKKSIVASAATAAPETTGSIGNGPVAVPAGAKLSEKILRDWIVQDVRGNHALIESRYGAVFDVVAGMVLPGLGKVETIKRQDGQWIVVTARGSISSAP